MNLDEKTDSLYLYDFDPNSFNIYRPSNLCFFCVLNLREIMIFYERV